VEGSKSKCKRASAFGPAKTNVIREHTIKKLLISMDELHFYKWMTVTPGFLHITDTDSSKSARILR
jgi:hypothetical protein